MVLTLEVVGQQASKLGASARKVFSGSGGTIGRLPENDWAIPDPYISSKHARIDYRDGKYFLVDTSTNGVFVNSQDNRLTRSQPYPLNNGDRIFIDAYEIHVAIAGPAPSASPSPLGDLFGSNAVPTSAAQNKYGDQHSRIDGPSSVQSDPFASADPFGSPAAPGNSSPGNSSMGGSRAIIPAGSLDAYAADAGSDAIDPLKLLGLENKRSTADVPRAQDLARQSPLSDHFNPPTPIAPPNAPMRPTSAGSAGGSAIPDDYDPLSDGLASSAKAAAPIPAARPSSSAIPSNPVPSNAIQGNAQQSGAAPRPTPGGARSATSAGQRATSAAPPPAATAQARPSATPPPKSTDVAVGTSSTGKQPNLNMLLVGAGLPEAQITPDLIENFGRILRVVVAGLMDVLRARERIKDEFRMRMTTFKAADNNPLKFSANVDDALHNLLVKRNAAYLSPVEAFEDAFQDVRNHQMAMLAGVKMAFDAMLGEFDPDRLREQFDRQVKKGSLLSGPAKLRYWELYTDKFRGMVNDRESAFRDLFGEEFARAYEEQLERLKALDRANKK